MRRIFEHFFFYIITSIFAALCTATFYFFILLFREATHNFTMAISTIMIATPMITVLAFVPYLISLFIIKVIIRKDNNFFYIFFGVITAGVAVYLHHNLLSDISLYMPAIISGGMAGRFYKYMEYRA